MTNQAEAQNSNSFIGRQTPTIIERTFSPEALWAMGRIGGYDITPDAKSAVYNVSYYSVKQNKSHTVIYTINTDGTGEKLLTTSNGSEVAPKYIAKNVTIVMIRRRFVSFILVNILPFSFVFFIMQPPS